MPSFIRPTLSDSALAIRLVCLLAAVTLNFGTLAWLSKRSPPLPQRSALQVRVVEVVSPQQLFFPLARSVVALKTKTVPLSTTDGAQRLSPAHRQERMTRSADGPAATFPLAQSSARAVDTQPGVTTRFYSFGEVDIPASPVAGWELDAATLDAFHTPRIVFDLFVSDEGSVVDCRVVEPANMDASLRATLESRLRSTALLPAIRTGQPVDSVRRIELFVS